MTAGIVDNKCVMYNRMQMFTLGKYSTDFCTIKEQNANSSASNPPLNKGNIYSVCDILKHALGLMGSSDGEDCYFWTLACID